MSSLSVRCSECVRQAFITGGRQSFNAKYMQLAQMGWQTVDGGRTFFCSEECRANAAIDITPTQKTIEVR